MAVEHADENCARAVTYHRKDRCSPLTLGCALCVCGCCLSLCRQHDLISLIVDKHQVVGSHGLNLYLGEQVEEANMLRPEEYGLSLADVKCPGGSINDHVLQVLTYDYQPHKTTDTGTIPPSRSYGIMQVPRNVMLAPLRQFGPC